MTTVHAQHTEHVRPVSISVEASLYEDRSKVIPLFRRVATFEDVERWCEADPKFAREVKKGNGIWIDPNLTWSHWPDPLLVKYKYLGTGESVLDFYPVRNPGPETKLRVAYVSAPELVGEVGFKSEDAMFVGGPPLSPVGKAESLSELEVLKLANSVAI